MMVVESFLVVLAELERSVPRTSPALIASQIVLTANAVPTAVVINAASVEPAKIVLNLVSVSKPVAPPIVRGSNAEKTGAAVNVGAARKVFLVHQASASRNQVKNNPRKLQTPGAALPPSTTVISLAAGRGSTPASLGKSSNMAVALPPRTHPVLPMAGVVVP